MPSVAANKPVADEFHARPVNSGARQHRRSEVRAGSDVRSVMTALNWADLFSERRLAGIEGLIEGPDRRVDTGTREIGQWRQPRVLGVDPRFEVLQHQVSAATMRIGTPDKLGQNSRSGAAVLDTISAPVALTERQDRQH